LQVSCVKCLAPKTNNNRITLGGFISAAKGWRWVFWILTIAVRISLSPNRTLYLCLHPPLKIYLVWRNISSILLLRARKLLARYSGKESHSITHRESKHSIKAPVSSLTAHCIVTGYYSALPNASVLSYRAYALCLHCTSIWPIVPPLHNNYVRL
jgi:MFS family permease